jgi:hypothetical protein
MESLSVDAVRHAIIARWPGIGACGEAGAASPPAEKAACDG